MNVCVSGVGRSIAALVLAIGVGACSNDPQVAKQQHLARGKEYVAQQKDNEAVIEFRNAVQLDARFGEARYALAEAYARLGDAPNAYREYVRAADLLDDPDVQLKAGMLLLFGGRAEDAKARADKALARDPKNVEAHILLGNALAGMKDLDGAVRQMQKAIKEDPNPGLSYATLGNFELQRGNRAEAEAAYAKAIELAPALAPARVALGNYQLATGDREQAAASFLKAVELDPHSAVALRSLVALYLTSRQFDQAEPYLVRLADDSKDSTPDFVLTDVYMATGRPELAAARLGVLMQTPADVVPARLRLAAIDYGQGRRVAALAHVDAAIAAAPKAPQAYVMKARFLLAERKAEEALAELTMATTVAPEYAPAHFWEAQTYLRERKFDEAKAAFTEALKLAPMLAPAQVGLSAIHLQAGDADQALRYAEQAVQIAPRDRDARAALVRALLAKQNLSRAQTELDTLATQAPDLPTVHVLKGAIALMSRNAPSAERAFAHALEIDPASYGALNGLVATQLSTGNIVGAKERVAEAVAKAPTDATTLLIAAGAQLVAKDYPAAETLLRQAIDADPQRIEAYTMLGRLYASQRRLDDAIGEFEQIAKRRPTSIGAHTAVATLQLALNRRADAKARYQHVLSMDPNAAVAANNLAWIQAEDGDNLDVALQHAQTAVARLPESAEVSDTLGFVYHKKGLYSQAIGAFQTSLELDPRNPIYHYHLGLSYARSGDAPQAKRALAAALRLSPSFAGAEEARATLASLP